MKKFALTIGMAMMAALLMVGAPAEAQTRQQKRNAKIDAKKEAKILIKQDFKTMDIPIRRQLEDFYLKRYEVGEDGLPAYLHSSGIGVGNTFAAARLLATADAKVRLAGNIETMVMDEVKGRIADNQLSAKEAVSITKALEKATLLVAERLSRAMVVQEYYRILPNDNYDVHVMLMYSTKTLHDMMLMDARKALEEEMRDFVPLHESIIDESISEGLRKLF